MFLHICTFSYVFRDNWNGVLKCLVSGAAKILHYLITIIFHGNSISVISLAQRGIQNVTFFILTFFEEKNHTHSFSHASCSLLCLCLCSFTGSSYNIAHFAECV